MEILKKYWWVVAWIVLIFVIIYLNKKYYSGANDGDGCKKISWEEWLEKKQNLYSKNHDWDLSQQILKDQGFCEHKG